MATTFKEKLFTGRTVEFKEFSLSQFELFLEYSNNGKSFLEFLLEVLIDQNILVAIEVEDESGNVRMSKEEADRLSLLTCEAYELMFYIRRKTLPEDNNVVVNWKFNGTTTTHTFDLSDLSNFIIKKVEPLKEPTLETELSNKEVIIIQKETLGQIKKHLNSYHKPITASILRHNPKQKRFKNGEEKPPISLTSESELNKILGWKGVKQIVKSCSDIDGSYSLSVELKNPNNNSETVLLSLISNAGLAAFFSLGDDPV